jgi:uncharacterized protein GlcG (DUF336 family)
VPIALPAKKVLTLEAAKLAAAAAEAAARQGGWKVVIAVVDDGGHALCLHRIDGTQASSVETALGKARTAVHFKRPTRILEEMVNQGRYAFLSIPGGAVLLQGGLPIEWEGQLLGAVGVSGVKASDDEIIARAGVDALLAALGPH